MVKKIYSLGFLVVLCMSAITSCEKDQDTPNQGEIIDYSPKTVSMEISQNVANNDGCVYFSFKTGKTFGLSSSQADESMDWDIGFDKVNGFSNGGTRGNGNVEVMVTDYTDFDAVVNYTPFTTDPSDWHKSESHKAMTFSTMPPTLTLQQVNPSLVNFYTFEGESMPPKAKIDQRVRIIKTQTGHYVKLQFLAVYKDEAALTGFGVVKFKYAYLNSEGQNAEIPGLVKIKNLQQGKLGEALSGKNLNDIQRLIVTGSVNQADADFIKTLKNLQILDLQNASITVQPHQYFLKDTKTKLRKIILPTNLETIGQGWLSYCPNLEEVDIPGQSLRTVMDGAFAFDGKLRNLSLPSSVLTIEHEAFSYCGLEKFVYPENITDVEYKTFYMCKQLKIVVLPKKVKIIQGGAFAYCKLLKELHVPNATAPVLSEDYKEIRGNGGKLFAFEGIQWDDPSTNKIYFHVIVPKNSKDAYLNKWEWQDFPDYITEE